MVGRERSFRPKVTALFLILLAASIGLAGSGFYIWQRNHEDGTYLKSMWFATERLRPLCERLTLASEQMLIIDNPPSTAKEADLRINILSTDSAAIRSELTRFDSAAKSYAPSRLMLIGNRKAQVLQERATSASAQIRETLDDFDKLLGFLAGYYRLEAEFTDQLGSFNSLHDLNVLQGSSVSLIATSDDIEKQIGELRSLSPPPHLETVRSGAIAARQRAASGFDSLATALSPPIDGLIYAAAGEIEAATADNDETNGLLQTKLKNSPIIKNVGDLREKVSDFTF